MPLVSTIMALHGISPTEPLTYGSFTVVAGARLKEYAIAHLGYDEARIGFDDLGHWSADAFVIHVAHGDATEAPQIAIQSEEEIHYFVAALSFAYWVYHDLHGIATLSHEAYQFIGSRRYTLVGGTGAHADREEHRGRGFTTAITQPPITVDLGAFTRMVQHPIIKPLFDCFALPHRTDLQAKLLKSVRCLYFASSANTGEYQLVGAIASIDSVLALSPEELTRVTNVLSPERVKVKEMVKALLGAQRLGNVIRFRDKWHKHDTAPLYAYDQRNRVVHDGEQCDYSTIVDAYRLAVRVLCSVAQVASQFESRIDLVHELHARFGECWWAGGGAQLRCSQSEQFGYPWVCNGMPDFLPFVLAQYYRLYRGVEESKTRMSTRQAVQIIMHQRSVSPEVAYKGLQQSMFTASSLPPMEDIVNPPFQPEELRSALHYAVFCRQHSPLAWVINEDSEWIDAVETLWRR